MSKCQLGDPTGTLWAVVFSRMRSEGQLLAGVHRASEGRAKGVGTRALAVGMQPVTPRHKRRRERSAQFLALVG